MHDDAKHEDHPGALGREAHFTGNDLEGVTQESDSGVGGTPGAPAGLNIDDQSDDPERARGTLNDAPGQGGTPFGSGTSGTSGTGAGSGGLGGGTLDGGSSSTT